MANKKVVIRATRIEYERDPMTKVSKTVYPWEVPVFRAMMGDEKVKVLGVEEITKDELPDAETELENMRRRFGEDVDTKQSRVDIVYGRGREAVDRLEDAIANSYQGDIEAAQKVVDGKAKVSKDVAEAREAQYVDAATGEPMEDTDLTAARPLRDNKADVAAGRVHRTTVTVESTDPLPGVEVDEDGKIVEAPKAKKSK